MDKIQKIYHEFPRKFWLVVAVSFIDRIGGTLLFPFFSLYITQRFDVGMTQAGYILGLFSIFGLAGQFIGGALTDKFGRRNLILFGLIFSAISTLSLGLVNSYAAMVPLAMIIGLLSDVAGPAHQAMIADILPEHQRQEGFGILRVVANMSWIIGPTIGGLVARQSFLALFIIDAVISCVVAILFYLLISETKPEAQPEQQHESIFQTFKGYGVVLRDSAYMAFLVAGMIMGAVYQQMYNSLSVYMRDSHGIEPSGYGFMLTSSAIVVILFQFSVTRLVKKQPPFLMMAFGTIFYMIGFSMFGFVSAYWLFVLAVVIITVGEMIIMPVTSALAANFAPADMRGRYMAVFGLTWAIPATIAPTAAGVVLDNYNPNLLWYIGGALCLVSVLSFYALHLVLGKQKRFQIIEEDKITKPETPQTV
ncbi:MAG: MFS transporter [Anaerolineaceae bacterium]|nr:MFS transporter [Anaerolineaceae bacterium]MBN2676945.1 MFS transporter [Anaerolineaceae bacterium]